MGQSHHQELSHTEHSELQDEESLCRPSTFKATLPWNFAC